MDPVMIYGTTPYNTLSQRTPDVKGLKERVRRVDSPRMGETSVWISTVVKFSNLCNLVVGIVRKIRIRSLTS